MMGVFVNALVWIAADRTRAGEQEIALRRQPLADEVAGEALSGAQLDHLVEPRLCDVEHQERGDDDPKTRSCNAKASMLRASMAS